MSWLRTAFASTLVPVATVIVAFAPPGRAVRFDDIPASEVRAPGARDHDLAKIRSLLASPVAEQRLADAGLTRDAVLAKVERMTPAEIHYFVERADAEEKAGGDAVGFVIGLLIIVLIVVLIFVLLDKRVEVHDRSSHSETGVKERPESGSLARGAVLG